MRGKRFQSKVIALLTVGALSLNLFGITAYAASDTRSEVSITESDGVTTTETVTTWSEESGDTIVSGNETTVSEESTVNGEAVSASGSTVGSERAESASYTENDLSTDEVDLPEGTYSSSDSAAAEFGSADTSQEDESESEDAAESEAEDTEDNTDTETEGEADTEAESAGIGGTKVLTFIGNRGCRDVRSGFKEPLSGSGSYNNAS